MRILPSLLLGLLLVALLGFTGCTKARLLFDVGTSLPVFSPNGTDEDSFTEIAYTVGENAKVSIEILDQTGKPYPIAESLERVPGSYVVKFAGAVATSEDRLQRRLLPDGKYRFVVRAEDDFGRTAQESGEFEIVGGDPESLSVRDLIADKTTISPDGDALDDETKLSYSVNKPARVSIYAVNAKGDKTVLQAPRKQTAGPQTHHWNGTYGNSVLPDGRYDVHVRAEDKSGNVADSALTITINGGGIPRVEITSVDFSPSVVPVGGYLNVTIRVKNTGDTTIQTLGPPPGTEYSTDQTFNYWTEPGPGGTEVVKYFERPGVWRVAVGWNLAGRPYPVRWGLTEDLSPLEPGQEATIQGRIKIAISRTEELYFWAGVEQGGVGFPGGEKGIKRIRISY